MIYGLSDLHLDITKKKDMSVFGQAWQDYEEKIMAHWRAIVEENDTVLVPGDISWAMNLSKAKADLDRIEALPGTKILLRGNHDYWWQSLAKIESVGYRTIRFLQNNAFVAEKTRIVGARGWDSPDSAGFAEEDAKIFRREVARLKLSIAAPCSAPYERTICMLHYPPFLRTGALNEIGETVRDAGIALCVYGHLHSEGLRQVREGIIDGVFFRCLSGDYIDFYPQELGV